MSKKNKIRALLLLATAFGIFFVYSIVTVFIPRYGTAPHEADLQTVCAEAGPRFVCTLTNSFVQNFPFDGPIGWKLIFFKDTALFLSGRVDTNRLQQFIFNQPDAEFLWTGANGEGEIRWPNNKDYPTTTWTNIWFRKQWSYEGYPMSVEGTLDIRSDSFTFRIW